MRQELKDIIKTLVTPQEGEAVAIEQDEYKIFVRPGSYALSQRKIDSLIRISQIQQYYQCNPVRFISDFFNIELLDAQALIIQLAWNCPNVLVVASRGAGKSTIIDLLVMSKGMLFCNFWAYIASGTGSQAEQTFTTLENLANDNIDTFVGSTGSVFKNEVEIKNSSGDGFSHSSNGFTYNLFNGSKTITLNSNIDARRGKMHASPVRNDRFFIVLKKSGKLECQSEWKAICNNIVTRRAYGVKLQCRI